MSLFSWPLFAVKMIEAMYTGFRTFSQGFIWKSKWWDVTSGIVLSCRDCGNANERPNEAAWQRLTSWQVPVVFLDDYFPKDVLRCLRHLVICLLEFNGREHNSHFGKMRREEFHKIRLFFCSSMVKQSWNEC